MRGNDQGVDLDLEIGVNFQCDVFQNCRALGKGDFVEYPVYIQFADVTGLYLIVPSADCFALWMTGWQSCEQPFELGKFFGLIAFFEYWCARSLN